MTETLGPDTPLYNSKVIQGYVEFAVAYCAGVNTSEALTYAGIEPHQIEDEDHWFTQAQVDRFHEKLLELTGNKDIARQTGRYAASSSSLGMIRYHVISFLSPRKLCETIEKLAGFFSRSVVWEAKNTGPRMIEIAVTPRPGVREKPFQCQNRVGYIEGVCSLFGHTLAEVEHVECVFHGGRRCLYVLKWSKPVSEGCRKARNYLALFLLVLSGGLFFVSTPGVAAFSLLAALVLFFALSARMWRMEKDSLCAAVGDLRSASELFIEKLEAHQNQARLMQEIGQVLSSRRSTEGILQEVAQVLENRLDYDRGAILLADREKGRLNVRATFGDPDRKAPPLEDALLSDGPESSSVFVRCFREQRPFLVNDVDVAGDLSALRVEFARSAGAKAFICCPISCSDEAIGVLVVGNMKKTRSLLQRDIDLLTQVSRQVGVSIRNIMAGEAEKAASENEARFRAVVEKSSEVIVLTDEDGNYLYVSPPATAVFGRSPDEYVGRRLSAFVHPDDCGRLEESSAWLRANPGETKDIVVRARHKDGTWRWIEITARNLLAEPGVLAVVSNVRDVTGRKIAEETLRESENKFKHLVEEASVGVYLIQDGVFKYVNAKCAEIFGYDAAEMIDRVKSAYAWAPGEALPDERTPWHFGAGQCRERQFKIVAKTGSVKHVETHGASTIYQGRPAVIGMMLDITGRKADEEALRWKTTFLEALVKSTHDGILVIDSQGRRIMENQQTADIWKIPKGNLTEKERMAHFMSSVKAPERLREKILYLNDHPDETMHDEIELKIGTIVDTSSSPIIGEDGRRYGRIWTFRDITELRHYWDMLVDLSTTDGLTELANRRRFDEFLDREWRRSMRDQTPLSLILMDIDFFKEYNDYYGHLAGDDCLRRFAGVLRSLVRRPGDLVARYGGEEFACILPDADERGASALAEKIMRSINRLNIPHAASKAASRVTLSFGAATMVPKKGQSAEELVRLADYLLYSAKSGGRNRIGERRQKAKAGIAIRQ
jgi:diguanylate cyclase (GGDEF)-like protein/PAS domain S-box-containing protein